MFSNAALCMNDWFTKGRFETECFRFNSLKQLALLRFALHCVFLSWDSCDFVV